jgi:hypothetical protein
MENNLRKTIFKEFITEKRESYNLVLFAYIKEEWFKEHSINPQNDISLEEFILKWNKELEVGKYFHNEMGPAYGAQYVPHDKTQYRVTKHAEYFLDGMRVNNLDKQEINLVLDEETNTKMKLSLRENYEKEIK